MKFQTYFPEKLRKMKHNMFSAETAQRVLKFDIRQQA